MRQLPAYDHGGRVVDLRLRAETTPEYAYRLALGAVRLARLFQRERPERIVSFMESANFPAIAAAALTRLLDRLWVSVRTNPSKIPTWYRVLVPWVYRMPERVIACSNGVKKELDDMGIPSGKLSFIPNPVVTEGLVAGSGAPLPVPFILGAGRLRPEKGFDRLLKAFANVDGQHLHLAILGEGEGRADLISLAHRLGISSRVHLPGATSNIETWYRSAECFVLTSRYEGWPKRADGGDGDRMSDSQLRLPIRTRRNL